jgi:hypothetical protein
MMALLQVSLSKTVFSIVFLNLGFVGFLNLANAGPLEDLSAVSKSAHTMATCPDYNSNDAHSALSQAAECVQVVNGNNIGKQMLELSKIKEKVDENVEDRYFAILATQHANELVCASDFAAQVSAGNPKSDKILKNQFRELRRHKLALREAVENVAKNPQINIKACPFFQADLDHDFPDVEVRKLNKSYAACSEVIAARSAYNATLAAIPLSQLPAVTSVLEKYLISNNELSDSDLEKLIHTTYKNAKSELADQAKDIRTKAQSEGGAAFSRSDKHALLADPRLTEKVLSGGGQSDALKAVACTADARYGSGADDLDKGLFVGSLLIGGGMAVKAVGMAAKLSTAANTGRALGVYSLTTSNIIKIAAIGGVQGTATWSEIEKNCSSNSIKSQIGSGGACSDAPSIKKMEQDNCYLSGSLAAMQMVPAAAVAKLATDQNRLSKVLKAQELEAKIQARREIIAARNPATGDMKDTLLKLQLDAVSARKEKELAALRAKSPEVNRENIVAESSDVTDLSAVRRKKELAAQKAEREKLAQEQDDILRSQYDHDSFKINQAREVASMKAEGLYTQKPPVGLKFEEGSLVKAGKGPFESKAGDINLLTEEQIIQLERHNPGTALYNFKTGEEFVINVHDFDKQLLKLKIGGKFSQWGFKVNP